MTNFINFAQIVNSVLTEANNRVSLSIVSDAINNKNIVKIYYNGDKNNAKGERIIEPYVLGRNYKGNVIIRAFQENGDTDTYVPEWKIFRLDRIASWLNTNNHFNQEPNKRGYNVASYNQNNDKAFSIIRNQVTFSNDTKVDIQQPQNNMQDISRKNIIQNANKRQEIINPTKQQQEIKPIAYNNNNNTQDNLNNINQNLNNNIQKNNKALDDVLNNNDYQNLAVSKEQLKKNLEDYNKKKLQRLNHLSKFYKKQK